MPTLAALFIVLLTSLAGGLASPSAEAAAVYTFGKNSNGTRYIKHVDRPRQAAAEAEAANKAGKNASPGKAVPPPVPGRSSPTTRMPPPPPPVNQKALDLLNQPI